MKYRLEKLSQKEREERVGLRGVNQSENTTKSKFMLLESFENKTHTNVKFVKAGTLPRERKMTHKKFNHIRSAMNNPTEVARKIKKDKERAELAAKMAKEAMEKAKKKVEKDESPNKG